MRFYDGITEFIFAEHQPEAADIIFVPGGNEPGLASHAASLYHQGYAPYILPSGRCSITEGTFTCPEPGLDCRTEWAYFREILRREGVPESAILREDQATYTYENAVYSRRQIRKAGLEIRKAILCCQAFHARRCLMYYQEQFPDTVFLVSPVVTKGISKENWFTTKHGIETVLGEVERCGAQFHEIMKDHMEEAYGIQKGIS